MDTKIQHGKPFFRRTLSRVRVPRLVLALGLLGLALALAVWPQSNAAGQGQQWVVTGLVQSPQGQTVVGAQVLALPADGAEPLAEAESQEDGSWALEFEAAPPAPFTIEIRHPHFQDQAIAVDAGALQRLTQNGSLSVGATTLARKVTPGFWAATGIFFGVLLLIAFERMHNTTAALTGLSAIFVVTYVVGHFWPGYYIMGFDRALAYINWEVIFLVMGMMIVIAIIERTGIFQWTAFQAYRLSRGRTWLLVLILMAITAVASALLDNFTTMLLMAPISLQIAIALGINPLALIIPEILVSNVGGISTLIGTPTNILIGTYGGIGFSDFLRNQTVGVLAALVLVAIYVLYYYRQEWRKHTGGVSEALYKRLRENARLREPQTLVKAGSVFVLILAGFIMGEPYHIAPAVPALIGATLLLVWLKPDVQAMIQAVDWTTLVFFIALFVVIGGVQEVGLLDHISQWMADVIGGNLTVGILLMVFGAGTLSIVIGNIPLAASFLPIAEFLSGSIPGATNKVLYYALSMGAAMGGNGLIISAAANLVTAGITRQAGSPISFREYVKVGLPITYITLAAGFLWLLVHF